MKAYLSSALCIVQMILGGCAIHYTDSLGHHNTVGLFWLKVSDPDSVRTSSESAVRVEIKNDKPTVIQSRSIGGRIDLNGIRTGVSLGYYESVDVYPERDSVTTVRFDTDKPIEATARVVKERSNTD